jgi:hypothetical protein
VELGFGFGVGEEGAVDGLVAVFAVPGPAVAEKSFGNIDAPGVDADEGYTVRVAACEDNFQGAVFDERREGGGGIGAALLAGLRGIDSVEANGEFAAIHRDGESVTVDHRIESSRFAVRFARDNRERRRFRETKKRDGGSQSAGEKGEED